MFPIFSSVTNNCPLFSPAFTNCHSFHLPFRNSHLFSKPLNFPLFLLLLTTSHACHVTFTTGHSSHLHSQLPTLLALFPTNCHPFPLPLNLPALFNFSSHQRNPYSLQVILTFVPSVCELFFSADFEGFSQNVKSSIFTLMKSFV